MVPYLWEWVNRAIYRCFGSIGLRGRDSRPPEILACNCWQIFGMGARAERHRLTIFLPALIFNRMQSECGRNAVERVDTLCLPILQTETRDWVCFVRWEMAGSDRSADELKHVRMNVATVAARYKDGGH